MTNNTIQNTTLHKEACCTPWESIKSWITNISFHMEEFTVFPPFSANAAHQQTDAAPQAFYLGGCKCHSAEDFLNKIQSLIWITYRKNMEIAPHIYSDVGWGCLVRVTQMAFASMLLRYSSNNPNIDRLAVINAFTQTKGAQYSITKFVELGRQLCNKKVGDWYSMSETAMILQALQERGPLSGAQNLSVAFFHEDVGIEELLESLGPPANNQTPQDHHQQINISNVIQIPQSSRRLAHSPPFNEQKTTNKQIFLMVTTQLSQSQTPKDKHQLLRFMELPIFVGCLGGVPEKARFIIGKLGDKICYLDPHYVQQSVREGNLYEILNTYTCKKPRWMKFEELQPSLTLCFHLKNHSDVEILMKAIDQMKAGHPRHLLINYSWPLKPQGKLIYTTQYIEPDFEILDGSFRESGEIQRLSFDDEGSN